MAYEFVYDSLNGKENGYIYRQRNVSSSCHRKLLNFCKVLLINTDMII